MLGRYRKYVDVQMNLLENDDEYSKDALDDDEDQDDDGVTVGPGVGAGAGGEEAQEAEQENAAT